MTPRLAAGLTTVVGLSMLAGWLSAFRNRAYLGWLGLAFMSVSGYLLAYDKGQEARSFGLPVGNAALAQKLFLLLCAIAFVLAIVAAARETVHRIREIQAGQRAAEEAMLEILKASAQREAAEAEQQRSPGSGDPPADSGQP